MQKKKINMLFAGLGSVRMVKNCDLGPENAALGLRPQAAFSSPRSQFFTIRTSQPANNIYISVIDHNRTHRKKLSIFIDWQLLSITIISFLMRLIEIIKTLILLFILLHPYGIAIMRLAEGCTPLLWLNFFFVYYELR